MALNYLLHRHQIARMRSEATGPVEVRAAHRAFAAGYASQIRALRAELGAAAVETLRVT